MKKHVVSAGPARQGEKPLSLVIEEKYDQVRQLINMGKERGYLLYDEVNDMLEAKVQPSEEIDDLLSSFERYSINISTKMYPAPGPRALPRKPPRSAIPNPKKKSPPRKSNST